MRTLGAKCSGLGERCCCGYRRARRVDLQSTPTWNCSCPSSSSSNRSSTTTTTRRGGNDEVEEGAEELPPVIQDILAHGGNNLNADDYTVAAAAAPMVDDNNETAPENVLDAAEGLNNIFSGWEHSGICHHCCMIQQIPKSVLKF